MRDIKVSVNTEGYVIAYEKFIANQFENEATRLVFDLPECYKNENFKNYVVFRLSNDEIVIRKINDTSYDCIIDRDITKVSGVCLFQTITKKITSADDLADGIVMASQPISGYVKESSYKNQSILNANVDSNIKVYLDEFDALLAEIRSTDKRLATIINGKSDFAEIIDARGGYDNLKRRLDNEKNCINTKIDNNITLLSSKISSLASGSPLVAGSISEMTNTSRVYVNTDDGNWYYYNGNEWVIGGVYQATEDSQTVEKLKEDINFINKSLKLSINIYEKDKVDFNTFGGSRQSFKINNPKIGHCYAVFKKNGDYALLDSSSILIQYDSNAGVIHQYKNINYTKYSIEESCEYIVFASVNSTLTPLDLMVVDMTNLSTTDITHFDNGFATLNEYVNIKEVKPESIKYTLKYNIYNQNEVITKLTDSQNYQKQIFYCHTGNVFRFLTKDLKRLTKTNYNNLNVICFLYKENDISSRTIQNPTEDITILNEEIRLELFVQNTTDIPYKDIMVLRMDLTTEDDIKEYGYLPYSYVLKAPYYIENSIKNENAIIKPHKGKKILSIGDSYTYLNYYGKYLEKVTGCIQTPRGYNGARIFNFVSDKYTPTGSDGNITEQVFNAELLEPYDIITIMGGTNNYGYSTQPLGTINDPAEAIGSVYSEIKYVIEKILTLKPSIKMVWCTEPYRLSFNGQSAPGGYKPNNQGFTMEDVANAIVEVCRYYSIPCFDYYHCSGWNSYTVARDSDGNLIENKFTYDGLHPKDGDGNGGDLLGTSFGLFINTIA